VTVRAESARRRGQDGGVQLHSALWKSHAVGGTLPAVAASLLPMSAMPKVGQLAPDFELRDDQGKAHRLSARRGHYTVVYFYPGDDTAGCTKEACSFRDNDAAFKEADTEVWGLSPQGPASKAAFKAKYGLPFTLLPDEDHGVAEKFGAWGEKTNYGKTYMGIIRSSFLVGPDGRVDHVWPKVTPEDHAIEVLAALREARATPA
jgi:thioredoxin-dependent peroxiredoxin